MGTVHQCHWVCRNRFFFFFFFFFSKSKVGSILLLTIWHWSSLTINWWEKGYLRQNMWWKFSWADCSLISSHFLQYSTRTVAGTIQLSQHSLASKIAASWQWQRWELAAQPTWELRGGGEILPTLKCIHWTVLIASLYFFFHPPTAEPYSYRMCWWHRLQIRYVVQRCRNGRDRSKWTAHEDQLRQEALEYYSSLRPQHQHPRRTSQGRW